MTAGLVAQEYVLPPPPPIAAGLPAFLQEPQSSVRWTEVISAAPMMPPVIAAGRVFVVTLPGVLTAYDLRDGRRLWSGDVNPEHPIAIDADRVYIAAGEAMHALRAQDRAVAWRSPTGTLTSPPLAQDGWVIVTPAKRTVALRAADGTEVWSRDNGTQRVRGALAGDTLIVPLTNGRIQALDLRTGTTKWERLLGGVPGEPLVVGDRIYVGASDKYFYCLNAATGEIDWPIRIGAVLRGRPISDGDRVYFAALDNVIRAISRKSGSVRWQQGMPFRPAGGPTITSGTLLVAGPVAEVRQLNVLTGLPAGRIAFPESLVTAPAIGELDGVLMIAGVTGGLNESWKLTVASPAPPPLTLTVPPLR